MRARDFCVAVKRLARLLSTIRQYNVRDTPGAVFAGARRERAGRAAKGAQAAGVPGTAGGTGRRGGKEGAATTKGWISSRH